jgi:hypothetical protein
MFELGKGNLLIEVVPLLVACVFVDRGLVNKRFDQAAFSALWFVQFARASLLAEGGRPRP